MSILVTDPNTAYGSALVEALSTTTPVVVATPTQLRRARSLHDLIFSHRSLEAVVHDARDPEVTRTLLLACERHHNIRRVVIRSTADVYESSANQPHILDEDAPLDFTRASADLVACSYLSRMSIAVLRCAEVLAPGGQLWDYLQSRVCLRPLGFDPMINVLSVEDHVRAHMLALRSDARGVFNIPGADTLPLSEMIASAGRIEIPLPGPLLAPAYQLRTRLVGFEFRYDQNMRRFHFGGILDGSRARRLLGYGASARGVAARNASYLQPPGH
jgi:nucleoside-diphosphate-sugar epimerase